MYLSKIAAPLLGLVRPQLSHALKSMSNLLNAKFKFFNLIKLDLRPISSSQIKHLTSSTSTTTTTASDTTKTNPIDEYENLTNNEFEKKTTTPGSEQTTETKTEVHPFSVAQASK